MTLIEKRTAIIDALIKAAKLSGIHSAMLGEIENIRAGANPKDILGVRWCDLIEGKYDLQPTHLQVELFNRLV